MYACVHGLLVQMNFAMTYFDCLSLFFDLFTEINEFISHALATISVRRDYPFFTNFSIGHVETRMNICI